MWKFLNWVAPPAPKRKSEEDKKTIQRDYDKSKRVRTFQNSWKQTYDWLHHDTDIGMTCTICKTGPDNNTGSFINGCTNYRLEAVKAHDTSEGHRKMALAKKAKSLPVHKTEGARIVSLLNKATIDKLSILFRNAHAICKNGRPYTDFTKLCQLDKAKGLDIGNTYNTDKYCQIFVSTIADISRNSQLHTISKASFLSLISDGSTDTATKEAEILYLRTSVECKVSTYFVGIKNVMRGDAETISRGLVDLMNERFGSGWKHKLVAMGTDGASVMIGKKSGVVQKIRETTNNHHVLAIHCSAHRLELAYKDAVKQSSMQQKCDTLLLNLYLFYKYSPLNRSNLQASFQSLGQKMLIPTRVGGTRWLPHTKIALRNVLTGYSAILQHLEQLQSPDSFKKDASAKARNFLKLLKDPKVIYWLHLTMDIVTCLGRVSEAIQYKNNTLADICIELDSAKACLTKYITSDGPYVRKVTNSEEVATAICNSKTKILNNLCDNITSRFASDIELFRASTILSFQRWPADIKQNIDFGDEEISTLVQKCEPVLKACVPEIEIEEIELEWTVLKTSIGNRSVDLTKLTWESVCTENGERCQNLLVLINYLLTLPSSSVDAERGFSSMKQIKNDWRSRLSDRNLSDLMMVAVETPSVEEFDPLPSIHEWNSNGQRIRRPFYRDDLKNCSTTQLDVMMSSEGVQLEAEDDDLLCAECDVEDVPLTQRQSASIATCSSSDEEGDFDSLQNVTDHQLKAYKMLTDIL